MTTAIVITLACIIGTVIALCLVRMNASDE